MAHDTSAPAQEGTIDLNPDEIHVAKERRRKPLDVANEKDQHFIESVRRMGFLQPISVRPTPNGPKPYECVFGRRRLAVAKYLELDAIPARVVAVADTQMRCLLVAENTMREPMDYSDYIKHLKVYLKDLEQAFGPDPKNRAGGLARAAKATRDGESKQFSAASPAMSTPETDAAEPAFSSTENAGSEPPAIRAHATIVRETTGRAVGSVHEDIAAAKVFDEEDLIVFKDRELTRTQIVRLSKLDDVARKEALAMLAAGDPFDQAVEAGERRSKEEKEAAKKPPKPPTEDELSDADWLRLWCMRVRQYLQDPQWFDRDALAYRRIRADIAAFRLGAREHIVEPNRKGFTPFIRKVFQVMYIEHPDKWHLCGVCSGKNKEHPNCDHCYGRGYKLTEYEPGRSKR